MAGVTPPLAVFSTVTLIFTAYVVCRIIRNKRVHHHLRKSARASVAYGTYSNYPNHAGLSSQPPRFSRTMKMNFGLISSENVDVLDEGCNKTIYALKKKREPFSNKWALLDHNGQVCGEIKLRDYAAISRFASKKIANIDLVNPILGRRQMLLEKQKLLPMPYAVNFDYMLSHFTWVKQNSKKSRNLRSCFENAKQRFPVEKSLPASGKECDECVVAVAVPDDDNLPVISYTVSYDALLIDGDAIVSTLFALVSSLGGCNEQLRYPMALIGTQLDYHFSN